MTRHFSDYALLGDARQWLRERVADGAECPCCRQFAKVYVRKLNSGMAISLIRIYKVAQGTLDFVHVPTQIPARSREEGKLAYWGLLVESTENREDGGRAGWWRLTSNGREFVRGRLRVPSHARVYDGRCLGLVGDPIDIREALGSRFDYAELMAENIDQLVSA